MNYMLVILEEPGQRATRTPAEGEAVYERMLAFGRSLQERGLFVMAESLETADARAARVQVRGGEARLSDGPFAEAKEMVGGIFVLKVDSREQALAIARECPAAEWATVEVRALGPCFF